MSDFAFAVAAWEEEAVAIVDSSVLTAAAAMTLKTLTVPGCGFAFPPLRFVIVIAEIAVARIDLWSQRDANIQQLVGHLDLFASKILEMRKIIRNY